MLVENVCYLKRGAPLNKPLVSCHHIFRRFCFIVVCLCFVLAGRSTIRFFVVPTNAVVEFKMKSSRSKLFSTKNSSTLSKASKYGFFHKYSYLNHYAISLHRC